MKRCPLILVALILGLTISAEAQRPTGTVVSGATSAGTPVTVLTDANGVVSVQGVSGGAPDNVTVVYGTRLTAYSGLGSTVTTLALSSGTIIMTAATVDVMGIRCNNTTGSAVFITLTDTAGNLLTGEATAKLGFAIPAYSEDYPVLPGSFVTMVGIKMYAGTASAVNCAIWGRQ